MIKINTNCEREHKIWRNIDLKMLIAYIETTYFTTVAKYAYIFK